MPVPDFQTFMRPLLAYGADGKEKNIREAINAIADEFQLSDEERSQLLPSGKQTALQNRVHWARTYLDKAAALKKTRRSHFVITDRGKELLKKNPKRIDLTILNQFPEFIAFRTKHSDDETGASRVRQSLQSKLAQTPDETIDGAIEEISRNLESQLLERILECSW